MKRVKLSFKRKGTFFMEGSCWVDVEDVTDSKVLLEKAEELDFVRFLPTAIDFTDDKWNFKIKEITNVES